MSKQRSFDSREREEKTEGYKTVQTDLPSTRFQGEKQVLTADQMGVTSNSKPSDVGNVADVAAKSLKSKIKLRPDVSVEDLGGKQVGGVPLAVETGLRNVAGARTSSVADDMSRTPYSSGKYRPETRYGKKRSEDLFELDNTAVEQVVPQVDDLPDLRSAPDSTVGYNGRQQFKQVRQKKNFYYTNSDGDKVGKLPQQLLNDASVDFADANFNIYTCGQVVQPIDESGNIGNIPYTADYPSKNNAGDLPSNLLMHKGNYKPKTLKFTVSSGKISAISIEEEKYLAAAEQKTRDEANTNWQIDANNIAKTMIKIQKELGRETTEKWTPLAYVIEDPYQINMIAHDIEATTGAIMAAAYRSAVSSLEYQRNITKKDGINPQRNAVKMITEGYAGVLADNNRNTISDLNFEHTVFNKAAYKQGAASAIIDMFDSTPKYRTKADLLGLQRSFGLHLSQCDNNLNPLHCKPNFIKVLDKAHMFSTVDGSYNPYLPIFETKTIKLINPLSLNQFLAGWKHPSTLTQSDIDAGYNTLTGTKAIYSYKYKDLRAEYPTFLRHPVIEGLLYWMLKHEGQIAKTYGDGDVTIPFVFDMQSPNMLSFMLCSAAQDVTFMRNITYRDFLFAGDQMNYIWDDLVELGKLNPLYSTQLRIGRYDEPLTLGKLANDTVIRLMYNDHKQLASYKSSDHTVQYYEPWVFNEQAFKKTNGYGEYSSISSWFDDNTPFNMSFPSIRDGVRHEYVDLIKSMDPKDVYACLDRKLDILKPCTFSGNGHGDNTIPYAIITPVVDKSTLEAKMKFSTIRYDGISDGRIVSTYKLRASNNYDLPSNGLYCIAKEFGWIDWDYDPVNVITAVGATESQGKWSISITKTVANSDDTDTFGASHILYYNGGLPFWLTSYRVEGDNASTQAIDRSAALTETFYRYFANSDVNTINEEFIKRTGLMVSRSYQYASNRSVYGLYDLQTNTKTSSMINNSVNTSANFIWTTLQRWFMPVNVFANAFAISHTDRSYDPMETCFWFGVCGFLAADYTQAVLERLSTIDQLGMDYTEDPSIQASPIFR